MDEYGENLYIRADQDPSYYRRYEVELGVQLPGYLDHIWEALESSGYILTDFDQWGLRYLSGDDPDLQIDIDELDDYGGMCRLVLRKGKLSEGDIDDAKVYLQHIYSQIAEQIDTPVLYELTEDPMDEQLNVIS